jgi:hypothetical protein
LLADVANIAGTPAKSCWWLKPDDVSVTLLPEEQPPPVDPDTVRVPPAGTEAGETLMEAEAPAGEATVSSANAATAAARAPSEQTLSTVCKTVKL